MNMKSFRTLCGVAVAGKICAQRQDEVRVMNLIIISQLVDMMMDSDLQAGVTAV